MTGIVASIRAAVASSASVSEMDRDGCSVRIQDVPAPRIVIDLDNDALAVPRERPHCDFLVFAEVGSVGWIVPVELKSGGFGNQHAVRQLQGGACFADELAPGERGYRLAAVIAHGYPIHWSKRLDLQRRRIRLRSESCSPLLLPCGESLRPIFSIAATQTRKPGDSASSE